MTERPGAHLLESTKANAEYWERGASKLAEEGKPLEEVMQCYMQATNAWRNAAYGTTEKLTTLELQLNTPEIEDFLKGTRLEAAHQIQRWGDAHDRRKSAENWFWLVGFLAGKALRAVIVGDRDKALHHCISSAAALFNWHTAIKRDSTGSGRGLDTDLERLDH